MVKIFGNRAWKCVLAAAAVCLTGCSLFHRKPAPVIEPPNLTITMRQFAGTPLTGATGAQISAADLSAAMRVDVTWIAVNTIPATSLAPLDSQSRLTVAPLNTETLLPAGIITRVARFGSDDAARKFYGELATQKLGKAKIVATQTGLMVPGATILFDAVEPGAGYEPLKRVAVSIYRPSAATREGVIPIPGEATTQPFIATTQPQVATVAIRLDDFARGTREDSTTDTDNKPIFGRETALLDDVSIADGSTFALLAPVQFDATPWRTLVVFVEIHAAREVDRVFMERLVGNLNQEQVRYGAGHRSVSGSVSEFWAKLDGAIEMLARPGGRRSPLLYLANETEATIANDFVLVADDASLAKLTAEVKSYWASADKRSRPPQALGWQMDRVSLHLMAQGLAKPDPPPEYASLLILIAGEAGRHADSIEEILKTVSKREDLQLRLTAENLIFLEDNSPSARVRAYDWLQSKGKAPKDFDPLGDAKSRRTAIDRALNPVGGNP